MKNGRTNHIVTIFGSSKPLRGDAEYQTAYEIGKTLAVNGYTICNGGYGGIMEASAEGAKDANGKTIGVIAEYFNRDANNYILETVKVKTLTDRLLKLIDLGDAYIALKGSTGTLVELSMVWEFLNKSVMKEKPIILFGNFWNPIVDTLATELVHEGFENVTKFIRYANHPDDCIKILKSSLKSCNI
ncbi:MAG: LOG family protein [Ignavibacteriales bacterium]|nr:LOG family protein [Ignavibacteriales bacterium]